MTIIQIEPLETGQHPIQSQSHRHSCWLEGWIAVPKNLEQKVWDSLGYCNLIIENNKLIAVQGPPGTGKSQTIVNLVAHLIANGKTVLVASRMDKAVDVVADRLNNLGAPYLALRAGRMNYQRQ